MLRASEEWYSDYCERTKKKGQLIKCKKTIPNYLSVSWDKPNNKVRSPHIVALEKLNKHPELLKGNHEHYAQVRFFYHCEMNVPDIYTLLHSTPNGGLRHKKKQANASEQRDKEKVTRTFLSIWPKGVITVCASNLSMAPISLQQNKSNG
ncbi:hypothetical protein [Xenorhabdus szentirmaii]|uniref:hypothetical protein n=1 Tax=Xenorhabdus szentirmaii TaxID=290112 RepID=UPI002B4164CB|nr:hypothetical protein [Xenorhabdus sp. M]